MLSPPPARGSRARTSKLLSILIANRQMYEQAKPIRLSKARCEFGPQYPNVRSLERYLAIIAAIGQDKWVMLREGATHLQLPVAMWNEIQDLELDGKELGGLMWYGVKQAGKSMFRRLKHLKVQFFEHDAYANGSHELDAMLVEEFDEQDDRSAWVVCRKLMGKKKFTVTTELIHLVSHTDIPIMVCCS